MATKRSDAGDDPESSSTGVPELDRVLGGGFPKGSTILIAGSSGSGKTILSLQWLFEGIRHGENGVYISLTEPLFKSVRDLETMSFYDKSAIEQQKLKILDMRDIIAEKGVLEPQKIYDFLEKYVRQTGAKRLCIDSVTAIAYSLDDRDKIRAFIFELGKLLATLGCTTFLTSEVAEEKKFSVYGVEEFISDAILRLDQVRVKDETKRVMQVVKVRGRNYEPGELYFTISEKGINVFPRLKVSLEHASSSERMSTGNATLDEIFTGGVFKGSSTLVLGSTGTGKSALCMQYIVDGLKKREPCMYLSFEESRSEVMRNSAVFGWKLDGYEKDNTLTLKCSYPNEKSLEAHMADIKKIVDERKVKRCVVDSLSSIASSFNDDMFVGFTKTLSSYLKSQGVTSFFTMAMTPATALTQLTEAHLSVLMDNIIIMRHVELEGGLRLVMNVVKSRGSSHSKELRMYDITGDGIIIKQPLFGYEAVTTGVGRRVSETVEEKVEAEFKKFIGPLAVSVLSELKRKGLTRENILGYIDSLTKQKILKKEDADAFKRSIEAIISTSPEK